MTPENDAPADQPSAAAAPQPTFASNVPPPPAIPGVTNPIDQWVYPVLSAAIRGTAATLGGVPPGAVLISACRVMGMLVGHMLGGDLIDILKMRGACQNAFMEGMRKNPAVKSVIAGADAPPKNGHAKG